MSTPTPDPIKEALPHIPGELIHSALRDWRKENIMRQIINADAKALIEQGRDEMESGTIAEFQLNKGRLEGIRKMLARVNALQL